MTHAKLWGDTQYGAPPDPNEEPERGDAFWFTVALACVLLMLVVWLLTTTGGVG